MKKSIVDYIPKKFKPYLCDAYKDADGYWVVFNNNVLLDNERHTANGETIKQLLSDIKENVKLVC